MKRQGSHHILHTFINRHGRIETRVNTVLHGATDDMAKATHQHHVSMAESAWTTGRTWNSAPIRVTGIVLIDAAENVLAEWTYEPKAQAAA